MAGAVYQYNALKPEKRQIRVLSILPGRWTEPITCVTKVVSLDEPCSYEALSYVWGDPKITSQIVLDGCTFNVTTNLWSALRRFRKPFAERVIWVDAICINQQDMEERAYQVNLMRHIFEGQTVLIWLGEDRTERKRYIPAFNLIQLLATKAHMHEFPALMMTTALESFGALVRNPWWSRIWTVQETILPTRATVWYGPMYAPWKIIVGAALEASGHDISDSCCQRFLDELGDLYGMELSRFCEIVLGIESISWRRHQNIPVSLTDLLTQFRTRRATDARDKVYALLGLITEPLSLQAIRADYSLPMAQIYASVVLNLIKSTGSLQVLAGRAVQPPKQNFPSWATGWSADINTVLWTYETHRLSRLSHYNASNGKTSTPTLRSPSLLVLNGIEIDTVVTVGRRTFSERTEDIISTVFEWQGLFGCETSRTDETRHRFYRTMLGDLVTTRPASPFFRRVHSIDLAACEAWLDGLWKYQILREGLIDATVATMTIGRTFFITQMGDMGLGPANTCIGDQVFVLFGGTVPFMLRPHNSDECRAHQEDGSKEVCFTIVGDCYLDGFMDGQALENMKYTRETLILH